MTNHPFDLDTLFQTPAYTQTPEPTERGLEALLFDGEPLCGRATRVFAWYGAPSIPAAPGPVPGIVLVHGGGGTAFADWVRLWNARGYAAIAMDLDGCLPVAAGDRWKRLEDGGPDGIVNGAATPFAQIDYPVRDQWTYHAVAAVIRAHSLLRSRPDVDPARIGITGISWGGFLTCIVAGLDKRFRFAAPVYGCGFSAQSPNWQRDFDALGPEKSARWTELWDPSRYLPEANLDMLWVNGTNDFAFPLPLHQRSYRLAPGPRSLCIRVRMPHGHNGPGENPAEIRAFADNLVREAVPLIRVTVQGEDAGTVWCAFDAGAFPVTSAELTYTCDTATDWVEREWNVAPAAIDAAGGIASAKLPPEVTAYFVNLFDTRALCVSAELVIRERD
ncbi:MAG: acetylxylan esterase [Capsulimonadaceae bacterium]|nr:acetylxylan esterase [Capsulimonadaceae bacterium]